MNVQALEYNADVRIKFASLNEKGGLEGDAIEEYDDLFSDFIESWTYSEIPGFINTRFDWERRAWLLTYADKKTQMAVVEHETGVEILISIGVGLAVEGIKEFIIWAWNKWKSSRAKIPTKPEPSLILETVTERTPEGRIRTTSRLEVRGPLTDSDVLQYVNQSLSYSPESLLES